MTEPQPPGQPQGTPPSPYGQQYPPQGQQPHAAQPHGQQYPQPQYPQPPQPGQPYGYPGTPASAPPSPSTPGGALGRVALIVALGSLAVGVLIALMAPVLIRTVDLPASLYGAIFGVGNALVLIVAVVAFILAIVALRRPGQQILAGIALGIAASEILSILVSWVSNLVLTLTYS